MKQRKQKKILARRGKTTVVLFVIQLFLLFDKTDSTDSTDSMFQNSGAAQLCIVNYALCSDQSVSPYANLCSSV